MLQRYLKPIQLYDFFLLRKLTTFCIVKYSKCYSLTINFQYVSGFLHSEISRISTNGNLHLILKLLDRNHLYYKVTTNTHVKIILLLKNQKFLFLEWNTKKKKTLAEDNIHEQHVFSIYASKVFARFVTCSVRLSTVSNDFHASYLRNTGY